MADNDVGGIGVRFTAEAAQLQQELQKIEQRLRQFDAAHGQKRIRLQAELVMPGNRVLQDFRRDLEKGFGAQGAAGRVKARIELLPPTAADVKALTAKIGSVKVKVIGDFEWGKAPPKTVTVKVVEEGSGRSAPPGAVTQSRINRPVAARPSHEEIQRSREAYRRAEREGGGAAGFTGGFGARGFAASGGGDDPYTRNRLREDRARMREVSQAKSDADYSRHRESVERRDRARRAKEDTRWAAMSPAEQEAERWAKSAELRASGIGEPFGPGGQIPFGFGIPATPPAGTAAGRVRAKQPPRPTVGQQLSLRFPELSAPPPVAGYAPGLIGAPNAMNAIMRGRELAPELDQLHGEGGLTPRGARYFGEVMTREGAAAQRSAIRPAVLPKPVDPTVARRPRVTGVGTFSGSRFASQSDVEAAAGRRLAAPPTAGTGLDVPTFLRRQGVAIADAIHEQQAATPVAAEPGLQEFLENMPAGGGRGGGRGRGRPAAGPPGRDDEVGQPRPGGRVAEMLDIIEQGKFAVQGARQAGQIRAVGTTVASQLGGLLGRGVGVVKVNEMTGILTRMHKVVLENADAFEELADKTAKFGEGSKEVAGLEKQLRGPRREFESLNKQLDALQPNKFAQMATGLAASIGGTIIGLGIFNAVATGLDLAGTAMGEIIERSTGYNNIAAKTTGALSDQTRALHGFAEGAVAAQNATLGLSDATAEFVHQNLDSRIAGQAANKNLQDQINLFQTALSVRRENQRADLPAGVDASALQTTGGLNIFGLQTPLFGTPSAQELIGRQLGGERFADITTFNPRSFGQNAIRGDLFGATGAAADRLRLGGGGTGAPITGANSIPAAIASAIGGIFNPEQIGEGARGGEVLSLRDVDPQQVRDFADSVDMVNEAMDKASAAGVRFAGNTEDLTTAQAKAAQAEAARQSALAEEADAPGIAAAIRNAGGRLLIEGLTGSRGNQIRQIQQGASQFQQGALLPNKQEAAFAAARPLAAQLGLNAAQGQLARSSIIPGQAYLSQLFAGRAPGGRNVNIQNPLTAGTASLPPDVLNRPGIDTSQLTEGLGMVETQANKGRVALTDMIRSADQINQRGGISSNLLESFNSLTKAAGQTAATIRSISQASAWMQVNLQVKQINEQIYLMSRSLADAKSFISGVGEGELGILQHRARGLEIAQADLGFRQQALSLANQELGISASQLQLAQRQRQINFARAVAGFVTPGQTPEEIAARQREAQLEADFAQKGQDISVVQLDNQKQGVALAREQLGISKEQFAVQQAMIDVQAERAVGDLMRAIGLLQEQARVTVQLQVNADAIDAYQAVLEEQKAQIQSVIEEAYSAQQTVMSNSAALAAQYSGTLTEWNNMLLDQLANYIAGAAAVIAGFRPTAALPYAPQSGIGGGVSTPGGGGGGPSLNAPGYLGTVSGAQHMIVGEAGPETVAILRNPRGMTWGGGGQEAGPTIIVNVTGNNVGSEQDADELAATIARKVEESMSRRSSLLGLRVN